MNCKSCGAPLKVNGKTLKCEYCGNEDILEEDLKPQILLMNVTLWQMKQNAYLTNKLIRKGNE